MTPQRRSRGLGLALALLLACWGGGTWAAEGLWVEGRVLAAEGGGLAASLELLPVAPAGGSVVLGRAEASGRFRVQVPAAGLWRLRVSAEGREAKAVDLFPLTESQGVLPVSLAALAPIALTVTDLTGRPIPEARIVASPREVALGRGGWYRAGQEVRTGAEGRASLAARQSDQVRIDAAGFETVELASAMGGLVQLGRVDPALAPPSLELRARCGRVQAAGRGRVLAGAWVWPTWYPEAGLTTDSEGSFCLEWRSPGGPDLRAAARGYASAAPASVDPRTGQVRFALEPLQGPEGRVVDEAGRGIADVEIAAEVNPVGFGPWAWARSDEQGRFRLVGLDPGGVYRVQTTSDEHLPAQLTLDLRDPLPPDGLRLTLSAGRALVGRVVGVDRQPLAGARVRSHPGDATPEALAGGSLRSPSWVRTDERGRFRLPPQPIGRLHLSVEAPGYPPRRFPHLELELARGPLDLGTIRLAAGAAIDGRVVDPNLEPLPGARVLAKAFQRPGGRALTSAEAAFVAVAESATDGRFRLLELPLDLDLEVEVRLAGFVPFRVELSTAEPPAALEVPLERASELVGTVSDARGAPIDRARILVYPRTDNQPGLGRSALRVETGPDGRFVVAELGAGAFQVHVSAPGFLPEARDLELAAGAAPEELRITLAAGATVRGQALAEDGQPVEGVVLEIPDNGKPPGHAIPAEAPRALSAADGSFVLTGVTPGRRRVQIDHPRFLSQEQELAVPASGARLEVRLARGLSLSGQVVDAGRAPVVGATVRLQEEVGGLPRHSAATDLAGRFRLEALNPGRYRVSAEKGGLPPGSTTVALEPGVPAEVEIQLPAAIALTGQLLGLSAAELAATEVWALGSLPVPVVGEVLPDGRYRVSNLAAGPWVVRAFVRGTARELTRSLEIGAGSSGEVLDLDLTALEP